MSWNIEGIKNKFKPFYNKIIGSEPHIFYLCETWHTTQFKNTTLSSTFNIIEQFGSKQHVKGRAKGGFIVGVSKSICENCKVIKTDGESCEIVIELNGEKLALILIYLSPTSTTDLMALFHETSSKYSNCIIMGDLNARIGKYNENNERQSKDTFINQRGRELIRILQTQDFSVLNGATQSDPLGEFTFSNKNGSSIVDLCLIKDSSHTVLDFDVLTDPSSSHSPILFKLNPSAQTKETQIPMIKWNEENKERFLNQLTQEMISVNNSIQDFTQALRISAELTGMQKYKTLSNKTQCHNPSWYDGECQKLKKATQYSMKKFRNAADNTIKSNWRNTYTNLRQKYKTIVIKKKTDFTNNLTHKLGNAKRPTEFFKALAYYRPKFRQQLTKIPTPTHFKSHFSDIFESKITIPESPSYLIRDEMLDRDFSRSDLDDAIKKLARNKAPGPDTIPNELWKSLEPHQREAAHLHQSSVE